MAQEKGESPTPCVECDDGFCEVHAGCDDKCGALRNPVTPKEIHASFLHYKSHSHLYGCSHGC